MVRELHEGSRGDGDDHGAGDYRPQRSGELTSITSRTQFIAVIGHDEQDWYHLLDDAGDAFCGNVRRRGITMTAIRDRGIFGTTKDVKWCPLCKRRLGMQ